MMFSCIHFQIWQYPPKIMKKTVFYTGKLYGLQVCICTLASDSNHHSFHQSVQYHHSVIRLKACAERSRGSELSEVVPIYSDAVYHTGVVMQSIKILSWCTLCLQASSCRTSASSQPKCKGKERQMLMLQCPSDVLKLLRRHIHS